MHFFKRGRPTDWPSTGTNAEEKDVSGTITVPEVAHDTEEDEFVVSLYYHMNSLACT
jgi:hypothetical protein